MRVAILCVSILTGLLVGAPAAQAGAKVFEGTWGRHLNPGGEVPTGKFRAFYISRKAPRKVVATEDMEHIQVNYAWSDLHGIDSQEFAAYFAGRLVLEEAGTRDIALALGHAQARLVIDGQVVTKAESDTVVPYQFAAGEHLIEVEYINRWHTTEFRVTIEEPQRTYSIEAARRALDEILEGSEDLWYAGVYEAAARDAVIPVRLKPRAGPVALVLASYSAVTWDLTGNAPRDVSAVVYGSYTPGTTVRLPDSWSDVPLLRVEDLPYADSLEPSYERHGSHFHVEDEGIRPVFAALERLSGRPLRGYAGAYDPEGLELPSVILDTARRKRLDAAYEAMERARRAAPKGVEDLFEAP